ncbi:MAG: hypothetical protein IJ743_02255 [Bacilli bacterium]|nr:hypothetical protein [Bacilli bacterium]
MLILNALSDAVSHMFHWILLWLDGVVYWAASKCYQLFMMLASTRIFEDEFFANFARRIYAILGVFMLFYLAYALLNAIVDPDKYSKGDKGVGNIAINFVVSLVILGLVPTIFSYAYRLQNFVLSQDLMGTIILGAPLNDVQSSDVSFGNSVSFTVLNTFINPGNVNVNMGKQGGYSWWDCKKNILEDSDYSCLTGLAYPYVYQNTNDEVKYYGIISTLVGAYLVYILLSFTLDLGVRVIKLAFYQLIAPIPIIMRALPSKKDSFNKWLKKTISTYADVFVRVGFMYMSVYFISRIIANNDLANYLQSPTGLLVLSVIIMGIFTFAKQISKEISDILGVNSDIKFGIRDKLKASTDAMSKTPIVGAGLHLVGRGVGAVTGGVGAGWTAFWNHGDMKSAAAWGAMAGAKNGGLQFTKQRLGLWSGVYGMKGPAGMFGKRTIYSTVMDELENTANDRYLDIEKGSNTRYIKRMENGSAFRQIQESKTNEAIELRNAIQTASETYDTKRAAAETRLADYQNQYNSKTSDKKDVESRIQGMHNRFKDEYLSSLEFSRDEAAKDGNAAMVAAYNQKINDVRSGIDTRSVNEYARNNYEEDYARLQEDIRTREELTNAIQGLESSMNSVQGEIQTINEDMAHDTSLKEALENATEKLKLKDKDGRDVVISSVNDISDDAIKNYAYEAAKKQYRKENEAYNLAVSGYEKESKESDIKKQVNSAENQALKKILTAALKDSNNKK